MGSLFHDTGVKSGQILSAVDSVMEGVRTKPVDPEVLDRALVKLRSDFYDRLTRFSGFGRADLLASFALFDDDPGRINRLESEFRKVNPAILQETAQEYLRPENRTILIVEPGAATAQKAYEP
jgi:predicted Zn-dependent peptidase